MVSAIKRMNIFRALLRLHYGPGAAILPPRVTRIHLDFARSWEGGHLGPRRFWRLYLPRLKFRNPAVPMIVNRHGENDGPATLTVYLRRDEGAAVDNASTTTITGTSTETPASSVKGESPAPAPLPSESAVQIAMKDRHSEDILAEFLRVAGAEPVETTAAARRQFEELEREERERGEDHRRRAGEEQRALQEAQAKFGGTAALANKDAGRGRKKT